MREDRRALSNWRGAVNARGDSAAADLARRALAAPQDDDPRALTHGFHVYPARLHPHLARTLIATVPPRAAVLDPFCGSGTVPVEALARGCRALGRDINPVAVRVARLKCSLWAPPQREALLEAADEVRRHVRRLVRSRSQDPPPESAREDFDPHVAWELAAVRDAVREIRFERVREALLLSLSSILVKMSRREGLTSGRSVQKGIPAGRPTKHFVERVQELANCLTTLAETVPAGTPPPDIAEGDARELKGVPDGSVDLIVTSPPYAGTYRYVDSSRMSADWIGLRLGSAEKREIGAKNAPGGVDAYRKDMAASLRAARRVLAPSGRAWFVVADLEVGAEVRPADRMMEELAAESGWSVLAVASQPRSVFGRKGVQRVPGGKNEHLVGLTPRALKPGSAGAAPPGAPAPEAKRS